MAFLYRGTEAAGSLARCIAYALGARLRSDDYFAQQAAFYRWLAKVYVSPTAPRK